MNSTGCWTARRASRPACLASLFGVVDALGSASALRRALHRSCRDR